ncbi:amidohydrolase family protein [Galactobacter valiniphilus]|uniref:amidohydrolase family protein n=1 Tax=Galactobacter valiniphilus TaxID=2676122 RepID=UPI0037355180
MSTTITNVQIFDGLKRHDATSVTIESGIITAIGGVVDSGVVVNGHGGTLLPGLIDAHVHTSGESLGLALRFGVTTELEMQGTHTASRRSGVEHDDTVADVRSAGFGLTPPGGHPAELFPRDFHPGPPAGASRPSGPRPVQAFATTPDEAEAVVTRLVSDGSDYIKFMVDDGSIEGAPGTPMLDQATLNAGVAAAHRHGKLAVAHALTVQASEMALHAGIDGLAHLFMDQPHTRDIVASIQRSGAFVTPCVVLNASMMGINAASLAADPRVASRLDDTWLKNLQISLNHYPQGRIEDVLATVKALHEAGVDILAGTDASIPAPFMGGLAHGASLHHELQYLVTAGLSPAEALTAATSTPARRFGLDDRGNIAVGLRADLLLVDGDPLEDISDSLNIRGVWRRGVRLEP